MKKKEINTEEYKFISSSSTLLNLACSDDINGAFQLGRIINLVGDSSSGKSFLGLSMLAECSRNKLLSEHELIYDDVEAACSFNMEHLFGVEIGKRIILNKPSDKIEDFFNTINELIKSNKPFVYVLDSFDALTTDQEAEKTEETLAARVNGKNISGSYGMQKAKISSQLFRMICSKINNTNSLLVIVSQTRDNINPMSFTKSTRSGGRALEFYSSVVLWMAICEKIKKTIDGNLYQIGVKSKVKISKNKITGKIRELPMTIYYDYGIDNIGDSVDYLIKHKVFSKVGRKIAAKELDFEGMLPNLINHIEQNNLEDKLNELVEKQWNKVEKALLTDRKRKY